MKLSPEIPWRFPEFTGHIVKVKNGSKVHLISSTLEKRLQGWKSNLRSPTLKSVNSFGSNLCYFKDVFGVTEFHWRKRIIGLQSAFLVFGIQENEGGSIPSTESTFSFSLINCTTSSLRLWMERRRFPLAEYLERWGQVCPQLKHFVDNFILSFLLILSWSSSWRHLDTALLRN